MVFFALKLYIINTIVQIFLFSLCFLSIIYCAIWIDVVDSEILCSFIYKMISVSPMRSSIVFQEQRIILMMSSKNVDLIFLKLNLSLWEHIIKRMA